MSTGLEGADWIWKDGDFIPWDEAKTHILSLAVQFCHLSPPPAHPSPLRFLSDLQDSSRYDHG
jgi:hypothetical protein